MDHFDYSAFDRYLAGEATPEERARIEAWLRENPARQRGLRAFQDAQVQALQPPHGFDIERLVVGIEQYTANASAGYDTQPTVSPAVSDMTAGKGKRGTRSVLHAGRRKISAYGIAIAASVAIALFGVQSVARLWDGLLKRCVSM
jgi:anti-sigma factor RsiW